ncbi:hypothetical protein [Streptococcus pluranimalium]|uniref:hypothetical protein n=1 Tax=Streptococcus pluranimalium TaxID=82348 RepID=UPI004046E59A
MILPLLKKIWVSQPFFTILMKLDYLTALALGRAFEASLVANSVDVATTGRSTTVPSSSFSV